MLKPKQLTDNSIPKNTITQQATELPLPSPKTFELVVEGKKLVSGPQTINVTEGDNITIKITSDQEEELHIHGYDNSVDLQKDIPAQLSFTANITGRFIYELEKSETEIGVLEVLPK
ncbi:hypothetical protein A3A60_04940 [Candidatus Curtissbacteria bacterium RIFCSPLOWO2_01_FULL_42_26]|uniref:EfeO-type cupredoxin-like domain-containing protein n=1 Tax=Candidatus Curtissbacteria bacterium RIFCSPLOWO2_01_FULL_42_26 TaxID=1797729 RepID=A0A1F5I0P3_9BACT|nr:MAG: hypothetical protein A3A60_04940 [Candidatus Curtissbacteria bacterium RIFCSPLOWO2_01_FULL_42_26]